MADGLAAAVESGPDHKTTLDAEWLRVLISGDKARVEELLRREEEQDEHGADDGLQQQTDDGQVAINVPGAGSFPILGVTSNGSTALHLAAGRGHVELATLLCDRAPSLAAARDKRLDTPLHCAAKAGHAGVAAVLLPRAGAALLARNQTGATALYEAVRHGRASLVDLLMAEAPEMASLATNDGFSPLYLAAMTGSAPTVRALLRPSAEGTPSPASFSGPAGRTALHVAASVSKEIAQAILGWEPQGLTLLTRADSSGRTPLHFAALYGKLDIVELFLQHCHASSLELASISDNSGSSPLHIAAMVAETGIIDELTKGWPNYYELVDDKGRNFLHRAVEHGQETVVRHICRNDMFTMLLNATDSQGNTPLHLAAESGNPGIASLILATTSVDMGITNKDGLTAGDLARRARAIGLRRYFLNPQTVLYNCLRWSRAPFTLEGDLGLQVDREKDKIARAKKEEENDNIAPAKEEEEEKDNIGEARAIASVLIATVAFAAAFTVPGGFIADDRARAGTAVLGSRFAFRAFAVSDTIAFLCSIVATCFLIYSGDARRIPRSKHSWYRRWTSGLVQVGAQFLIAAFAFQLVLGVAVNRWLIVFVYVACLASVLICFPSAWVPLNFGVGKAIWRRAGWRGLVNIHERPSTLPEFFHLFTDSVLYKALRRPLFALLISAMFVAAIVLSIALPNY